MVQPHSIVLLVLAACLQCSTWLCMVQAWSQRISKGVHRHNTLHMKPILRLPSGSTNAVSGWPQLRVAAGCQLYKGTASNLPAPAGQDRPRRPSLPHQTQSQQRCFGGMRRKSAEPLPSVYLRPSHSRQKDPKRMVLSTVAISLGCPYPPPKEEKYSNRREPYSRSFRFLALSRNLFGNCFF